MNYQILAVKGIIFARNGLAYIYVDLEYNVKIMILIHGTSRECDITVI